MPRFAERLHKSKKKNNKAPRIVSLSQVPRGFCAQYRGFPTFLLRALKLLKNRQATQAKLSPRPCLELGQNGPGAHFLKAAEISWTCKAIFISSVSKNGEVYKPETCTRNMGIKQLCNYKVWDFAMTFSIMFGLLKF